MKYTRLVQIVCLALLILMLGGCAVGTTRVKLDHDPISSVEKKKEGTLLIKEFKDVRTQDKAFIGNKRNGFGKVMGNIGTEEGVRLTEVLTGYFIEALREAGYTVELIKESPSEKGGKKFDALIEGDILNFWLDLYMAVWHYVDVKIKIKSPEDKILWEGTISGEEKNVLWVGATAEYERVIRGSLTKALNKAAAEFASAPFYKSVKSPH